MIKRSCSFLFVAIFACITPSAFAQSDSGKVPGSLGDDLRQFAETPAVPGYESALAADIRGRLKSFSPQLDIKSDNLDDVIVTIGSGSPKRLIVAPMDEPGYVVGNITDDGYIQLQRLPQFGNLPLFNELYSAQPVEIQSASGKWIPGVVAGLSIHLLPGRLHPPDPSDIENMYVDVGASSAAEVKRLGADLLSPVVMDRTLFSLDNNSYTAAAVGDRFGDAALVDLLRHIDPSKINGTLVVAFAAQQWAGARGLERLIDEENPDELIYVGRLTAAPPIPTEPTLHRGPRRDLGSGVLVGSQDTSGNFSGFAQDLKSLADSNRIPIAMDFSGAMMPPSYLAPPKTPDKTAHLAIATAWPDTPAEIISANDLMDLTHLLEAYAQGSVATEPATNSIASSQPASLWDTPPTNEQILKHLVETYAVSEHEARMRDAVKSLLPKWAKPETDDAGNLILQIGSAPPSAHVPSIMFVAHMDEIGYVVQEILPNGKLAVSGGGGLPNYFLGHAALVHTMNGRDIPAVMELPEGWDEPGFQFPRGRGLMYRADVGARSPEEVAQMGIAAGDYITIPKKYRRLAGTRANARSFDDRVGDTALISAAWTLGPNLKDRDVTFVWSTGEELGLVGAGKLAARLGAEGKAPQYVFAIDTFVSSDSPLESKRFGDAKLGDGFVVRAVDNSSIVPRKLVEKVVSIARANHIPVQYGTTGGGNDGSAFLRYGSIDVALGWPLRYSHSPGEVIDLRDLDGLAHIVDALSRSW
ncbi:MAG TPA: M20/M25/M40 family metallo-hydrolase [Candidatus Acidoferrales bacterium]|nr:M20/M25/M40 family metallo-hydrolase [Candidatus Acidoferrales bacterium]